jgi:hypothetical protein
VDAGVHHLQGEAEGVKTSQQIALLQEFYLDRLGLLMRHVEGAKQIGDYENNNTYQYIIAREDMHVTWARDAITDLGGELPTQGTALAVPKSGKGAAAEAAVIDDDIRQITAFHERWKTRIEGVTNARHKTLLRVILGEVLEHKRFFEQAKADREDVLGRRMPGASTGGGVLPTRWMD